MKTHEIYLACQNIEPDACFEFYPDRQSYRERTNGERYTSLDDVPAKLWWVVEVVTFSVSDDGHRVCIFWEGDDE